MQGLRFYNQAIEEQNWSGAAAFIHHPLTGNHSDFSYLFNGVLPLLNGGWIFPRDMVWSCDDYDSEAVVKTIGQLEQFPGALSSDRLGELANHVDDDWNTVFVHHNPKKADALQSRKQLNRSGSDYGVLQNMIESGEVTLMHSWDGVFWQIFSSHPGVISQLIKQHCDDKKLAVYCVNFAMEYPNPSNQKLQLVQPADVNKNHSMRR